MSTEFALQKFIFATLTADAAVKALVGDRVYDGKLPDDHAYPYIRFGSHDLLSEDAEGITADGHTLQLDIWSDHPAGSEEAKKIGSAVKKALHETNTNLESGAGKRLFVTGRRYFPDKDPTYTHGVLTLSATVEEAD